MFLINITKNIVLRLLNVSVIFSHIEFVFPLKT